MKIKFNLQFLLIILVTSVLSASNNSDKNASKIIERFDFKPVVLSSDDLDTTAGIDFDIGGTIFYRSLATDDGNSVYLDDTTAGTFQISYNLKGTVAESAENNPKNFLEGKIQAGYVKATNKGNYKFGAFFGGETDQKFNNRQTVYGLKATFVDIDFIIDRDIFAVYTNLGQVDPSNDTARELAYGNKNLDTYNRFDLEVFYSYNIGTEFFDTFEIDYRYFREIDVDKVIKEADLDQFSLLTYRLGFKTHYYIAFSTGELPFNQKDNQIFEIGFDYKIK